MLSRVVIAAGLVAAVAAGPAGRAGGADDPAPQARVDLAGVIEGMRRFAGTLAAAERGCRVRFREGITGLDDAGRPALKTVYDVDYARKGEMVSVQCMAKDVPARLSTREWVTWKDGVCAQRKDDILLVIAREPLPLVFRGGRYFQGLFVDARPAPGLEFPREGGSVRTGQWEDSVRLPDMVERNRRRYRVRPALEKVDGAWCVVLEWPGRDRIWVDPERGFVTLRREHWVVEGGTKVEWQNRDLVPCGPGLWLPTMQHQRQTPARVTSRRSGAKYQDIVRGPITVQLRPEPDDAFDMPLDGLDLFLVSDDVRGLRFRRHPDDVDPLEAALSDAYDPQGVSKSRDGSWWLVNGCAVGLVSMAVLFRPGGHGTCRQPSE